MLKTVRTLSASAQKATYGSNEKKTITVPTDRYVSEAVCRLTLTYDTAASPTVAEDGLLNLVKRVTLKINGKARRSWALKRYWYKLPADLRAKPEFVDVTTTVANGKKASVVFPIYFRMDEGDEDDLSALLPAHLLSTVELEIEWGTAADLGTNQTVSSAEINVTLKEVTLAPEEELDAYGVSGQAVASRDSRLIEILESETTKTIDAAYTDYGFDMNLPTGAVLMRELLFVRRAGARDDTQLTAYKIRDETNRFDVVEESWESSQARDRGEYGFPFAAFDGNLYLKGLTFVDLVDFGGLDLTNAKPGEWKLRANVIAPSGTTDVTLLHEQIARATYV